MPKGAGRFCSNSHNGLELGYHITLIKDATAAFEQEGMHAAHEVNGPRFAHAILTTEELLALLPATQDRTGGIPSPRTRRSLVSSQRKDHSFRNSSLEAFRCEDRLLTPRHEPACAR